MKTEKRSPNYANIFLGFSAIVLISTIAHTIGNQYLQGSVSSPDRNISSFDRPTDSNNQYPMGVPTRARNSTDCSNCVNTYSACYSQGTRALMTGQKIIIGEGSNARPISANAFLTNCANTFKSCKQVFQCK